MSRHYVPAAVILALLVAVGSGGVPAKSLQPQQGSIQGQVSAPVSGIGRTAPSPPLSTPWTLIRSLADVSGFHHAGSTVAPDESTDVKYLVATVPDPQHTHLQIWFDRELDILQFAASQAGYFLAGVWLPWPAPASASAETTSTSRAGLRKYPGLLIFRRDDSRAITRAGAGLSPQPTAQAEANGSTRSISRSFAFVFLIPETPTSGIDTAVLSTTIDDFIRKLDGSGKSLQPLRIWGPNFSGSVTSLTDVAEHIHGNHAAECIHAVSGSTTGFAASTGQDPGCSQNIWLRSTVENDEAAIGAFVDLLTKDYKYAPESIALLSETGTAYGMNAGSRDPASVDHPDVSARQVEEAKVGRPLVLHFPREISRLRNASRVMKPLPAQKGETQAQVNDGIQFVWSDAQPEQGGSIPTYSQQHTPLSQEAVMVNLAALLNANRIKVAGIFATDPLDTLFLIDFFRRTSPDVRLFVRDPDVLFTVAPSGVPVRGILAVGTYPMVAADQSWEPGTLDRRLLIFPSHSAIGQYNALKMLFSEMGVGAVPAGPLSGLQEYAWPGQPWYHRPALWLSTIGNDGYWPLRMLRTPCAKAPSDPATSLRPFPYAPDMDCGHEPGFDPHQMPAIRVPRLPVILACVIGLLALVHSFALSVRRKIPWLEDCDLSGVETLAARKAAYHVVALLSLALIEFGIGEPFFYFSGYSYQWVIQILVGVAVLIALSSAVILAGKHVFTPLLIGWKRKKAEDKHHLMHSGLIVLIATVGFGFFVRFWRSIALASSAASYLVNYRDISLVSGVSPFVPLGILLLIVCAAALSHLRRLTYSEYRCPQLPPVQLDPARPMDAPGVSQRISHCLTSLGLEPAWTVGFFIFMVAATAIAKVPLYVQSLEGPQYDWLLAVLIILTFGLVFLTWLRFLNAWWVLKGFLRDLERLPIRAAFRRMPREQSLPIWHWRASETFLLMLSQSLDYARGLISLSPTLAHQCGLQRVETATAEVFQALSSPQPAAASLAVKAGHGGPDAPAEASRAAASQSQSLQLPDQGKPRRKLDLLRTAESVLEEVMAGLIASSLAAYWKRSGGDQDPKPDEITAQAENLVALRYYSFLRYAVAEMRNLLFFVVLGFTLMLLALKSYPFRAYQTINWSVTCLFILLGAGVLVVLADMERNPVLSLLEEGSVPGKLGKNFYLQALSYGSVPLFTLLASQFPAISNVLFSWVQPGLEALR